MEEAVAKGWFERWERQQDRIIEARGERFDAMLDVLGVLFDADDAIEVLDLASGPAAISVRVLDRFPKARSVAVDVDPVLLAIGRGTHGDLDGRLTWVEHDLRDPAWTDAVRAAAGRQHVDAVLSSTALHWIPSGDLVAVYRACSTLLAPGGVLVNCDNMDYPLALGRPSAGSPTPRATRAWSDSGKTRPRRGSKAGNSGGRTSPLRPSWPTSTRAHAPVRLARPRRIPPRPRGARGGVGGGGLPRGRHGVAALHEPGAGRDPMILATAGDG